MHETSLFQLQLFAYPYNKQSEDVRYAHRTYMDAKIGDADSIHDNFVNEKTISLFIDHCWDSYSSENNYISHFDKLIR